jgi:D-beta-D-heptose 7-phosphate kinase/D-beta-D-heptose 1-phosphate adenosyltransferase
VYRFGTVDRISPEAPVPVFKFSHDESKPGMAGNVKLNLEALGCEVNFLHSESSTKTRLIDLRSRQHIVRIDNDIECTPIGFETAIPDVYDAIVISDYNKGTVSYELIEEIRDNTSIPIFIDTKKRDLARFEGCFIKINMQEYNQLVSQPSQVIVTAGDKGVLYNEEFISGHQVEVVDVCGAGDTFLSSLVYGYLNNDYNILKGIDFANKAASVTVQHLGNYAPKLEEIQ